jgi:predicted aldo/keto reductase-like oxidoreductase
VTSAIEYRALGRTGLSVSALSLGTEYLLDVPREQAVAVIRRAVDGGINYFDLFYAQPAFRDTMGEAFQGLRDRVLLTCHLGAGLKDGQYQRTRDIEECVKYLDDNFRRYRTDYVDVLFLHNCDESDDYEAVFAPGGLADLADQYRRDGKVHFIGFSSHSIEISLRAIETRRVDVLMFPINLTGYATPGRRDLFDTCVERGIGLVGMKPYAGGRLLQGQPEIEANRWVTGGAAFRAERQAVTPVQCLAYALSQPGVTTVVPGCSDLSQLEQALAWATATDEERDFSSALVGFGQFETGECVYCNHCLPCPAGIDIGRVMRLLDRARAQMTPALREEYAALAADASDCTNCEACVPRCPFGANPAGAMAEAARLLSEP